jgi:hypothetical protein
MKKKILNFDETTDFFIIPGSDPSYDTIKLDESDVLLYQYKKSVILLCSRFPIDVVYEIFKFVIPDLSYRKYIEYYFLLHETIERQLQRCEYNKFDTKTFLCLDPLIEPESISKLEIPSETLELHLNNYYSFFFMEVIHPPQNEQVCMNAMKPTDKYVTDTEIATFVKDRDNLSKILPENIWSRDF